MLQKKNIQTGKIKFFFVIFLFFIINENVFSDEKSPLEGDFIDLKILDKVSSKDEIIKIKIGSSINHKNLNIKVIKCKNSKFDDDPEIITYLQVKDINEKSKDKVFIFNGWMFASSPTLNALENSVYDLSILACKKDDKQSKKSSSVKPKE